MDAKNKNKKVIIFDLDETLTESKSPLDKEMASLLRELLRKKKVAVMGGAKFGQFEKQFLERLDATDEELSNLYILPTNAAQLYTYENQWKREYGRVLNREERQRVRDAIKETLRVTGTPTPAKLYGEQIEDREAQLVFSAHGQEAPYEVKKKWDPDLKKRKKMQEVLVRLLPGFDVSIGGSNSLDIVRRGIDKGYGVEQLQKYLGISVKEMLFIGDRLFEGGNDYSVRRTGIDWIEVKGPDETKKMIRELLKG